MSVVGSKKVLEIMSVVGTMKVMGMSMEELYEWGGGNKDAEDDERSGVKKAAETRC